MTGTLKGFDQLMNLVLDDVEETMRGESALGLKYLSDPDIDLLADDEGNERTRTLGLIVARGTLLVLISPADGSMPIPNPFAQAEEE